MSQRSSGSGQKMKHRIIRISTVVVCSAAAAMTSGCMVGPDFQRPAAPEVKTYTQQPLPGQTSATAGITGGDAQRFRVGADIPGQWWTLFHSTQLNQLIDDALKANPTLAAAQASLREARENYLSSEGGLYPSFDGSFSATRQKTSGALFGRPGTSGSIYTLYNVQAQVSYTLDLFGATRRQIEQQQAAVDYQRFQLEGAYLTLTSNVVTTAVQIASLREQLAADTDIRDAQQQIVDVVRKQFSFGGASQAALQAQLSQLAQLQALLPPLRKQLAQQQHQLATLTGRYPSELQPVTLRFDDLTLPKDLPVSLPSKLVEQRPDVRAAEAQLHEASAAVGVATAKLLPQVTLTADIGSIATHPEKLFSPGGGIWSLAGSLTQPLFDGGQLLHSKRAAVAAYDAAAAQYRGTVLTAFQNVADSLRALTDDADSLQAQLDYEHAAKASFDIARQQYKLGGISYTALLQAGLTYQQSRTTLAQAQAARYSDTAALFQALGGGWWQRHDIADAVASNDQTAR